MFPPPKKWTATQSPNPDGTYVALVSMFPMRGVRHLPAFLKRSGHVEQQLKATPGVAGFALGADLLRLKFYTLSAWESRAALKAFIDAGTHAQAMTAHASHMRRKGVFVQWDVSGRNLPLIWREGVARIEAAEARA